MFLLQVTHQVSVSLSLLSAPLQCVGRPLVGPGVTERPRGWFSGPVSL